VLFRRLGWIFLSSSWKRGVCLFNASLGNQRNLYPPYDKEDEMNIISKITMVMLRDSDVVAACITLEESRTDGMAAIMCVINNRSKGNPKKFKDAVLKKWQFSCMNPHTVKGKSLASIVKDAKKRKNWKVAKNIVGSAILGLLKDTSDGATHYHVFSGKSKCMPFWTHPSLGGKNRKCSITKFIGTHVFLKDID
jgi:hypothetical protein